MPGPPGHNSPDLRTEPGAARSRRTELHGYFGIAHAHGPAKIVTTWNLHAKLRALPAGAKSGAPFLTGYSAPMPAGPARRDIVLASDGIDSQLLSDSLDKVGIYAGSRSLYPFGLAHLICLYLALCCWTSHLMLAGRAYRLRCPARRSRRQNALAGAALSCVMSCKKISDASAAEAVGESASAHSEVPTAVSFFDVKTE